MSNHILDGKESLNRVVGLWTHGDSMRIRFDDGTEEDRPFTPFIHATRETAQKISEAFHKSNVNGEKLEGPLTYNWRIDCRDLSTFYDLKSFLYDEVDNDGYYVEHSPKQQFLQRSGITVYGELSMEDIHRMQVDIETYSKDGFPDASRASDKIIIIAISDNRGYRKLLHIADVDVQYGVSCQNEQHLLTTFVRLIHKKDPDVIEGHNFLGFDAPYIRDRCEMHDVPFRIGRDNTEPRSWSSTKDFAEREMDYENFVVSGRSIVDSFFLAADYDTYARDLPSYGLKDLAKHFGVVSQNREYVEGENISRVWDENPRRLLDYALDDVLETKGVVEQLGNASFALSKIVPMNWQQTIIAGTASTLECIMVREYMRQDHSLPSGSEAKSFKGGYTEAFWRGVFHDVAYADVSSLYPSIMLTWETRPSTDRLNVFLPMLRQLTEQRLENKKKLQTLEKGTKKYDEIDAQQAAQKILINCFSPDHEIMTKNGRKKVGEVENGDMVYSLNTETGEAEYKPVTRTYRQENYNGEMVKLQSPYYDFLVTPNHKFYAKHVRPNAKSEDKYEWITAQDFLKDTQNWKLPPGSTTRGNIRSHISLRDECDRLGIDYKYDPYEERIKDPRQTAKWIPNTYSMKNWLRLAGWYVSKGSVYESEGKKHENTVRGESWSFIISNATTKERRKIGSLLNKMGLTFYSGGKDFKIGNKVISQIFGKDFGRGSYNKGIPDWIWELDGNLIQNLLDTAFLGDGNKDGNRYITVSEDLKEDFIRLAFHCGKRAHEWAYDSGACRIGYYDRTKGMRPTVKNRDREMVDYEGPIECIEVADNHTVLAGRNGKFNWTGQSAYGMTGFPYAIFSDMDVAEFVTKKGRQILKKMIADLLDVSPTVVLADTDGAMFVVPKDMSAQEVVSYVDKNMPDGIEIDKDYEADTVVSYKAKNYAKKTDGTIELSGASLMGRQKEPFLRAYIHTQIEHLANEDVAGVKTVHDRYTEKIMRGELTPDDLCRRQRLKKTIDEYERGVAENPNKHRLGQYEVAKRKRTITGIEPKKGDTVYYYVKNTAASDIKVSRDARLKREYDNDESKEYYLNRLNTTAELFMDFFDCPNAVFDENSLSQGSLFGNQIDNVSLIRSQVEEYPKR
jgi:DNA polymerase elongation subunit (family B)